MLVQYIFPDTMSHDKETNADVALANTCLVTKPVLTAKWGAFFWDAFGSGLVIPDHSDHVTSFKSTD